jgi:hypothetical protein
MSRKDFKEIAKIISIARTKVTLKTKRPCATRILLELTSDFENLCASRNERFDRNKFGRACLPKIL